jgi:hypothetical protein
MEDSLTNAFRRYAELICATLRNHRTFDGRLRETGIVMLQPDKRFEFLPWVVEQMEEDEPFRHLVMATRATFPDQHYTQNDGLASHAVKNFFRRSGFYLDVFEGNNPNIDRVLEEYAVPFRKKERQITYLTLLQGIKFSAPGSGMKFDNFEIRRFSDTELAAISGNRVNQVFYPWAMLNVERLRDHWFIVQNCSQYHSQSDEDDSACFDRIARALSHMDIVTPVYKPFVEEFPFGSPLQILSLFPWHKHMPGGEEEWGRGAWSSYHFPFTIEVHDGLIWGPHPTPDLSALDLAPVAYNLPNGEVFDGEEIPIWIDFDEDNTHHFKFFVQHKEQYFAELKPREYGWEFFERAIAYFMKASRSTGLEQLLWNIITMEALLGENKKGGNKIFKGRITRILRNNNIKTTSKR